MERHVKAEEEKVNGQERPARSRPQRQRRGQWNLVHVQICQTLTDSKVPILACDFC